MEKDFAEKKIEHCMVLINVYYEKYWVQDIIRHQHECEMKNVQNRRKKQRDKVGVIKLTKSALRRNVHCRKSIVNAVWDSWQAGKVVLPDLTENIYLLVVEAFELFATQLILFGLFPDQIPRNIKKEVQAHSYILTDAEKVRRFNQLQDLFEVKDAKF